MDEGIKQYVIDCKFEDATDEHGILDLDKCWDVLYTPDWEAYCHLKIEYAHKVVASPIVVERLLDRSPFYFENINLEIKE